MTFDTLIEIYKEDIDAVVRRYIRSNWRLEYEDLWQEAMLSLWQALPYIEQTTKDRRKYVQHVVARRMKEIITGFKRDALFNAVSLNQLEGYEIDIDEEG